MAAILVVDDDNSTRKALRDVLDHDNHYVALARDGLEAFNLLKVQTFDLVLVDIVMPVIDGPGLIKRMRHNFPKTRVMAMSGFGNALNRRDGEPDTPHFLAKPFTIDEVRDAVDAALPRA